jgi:hypothetical protein
MAEELYNMANSFIAEKFALLMRQRHIQESTAISKRRHDQCLYSARRKPWLLMDIACEGFLGTVFFWASNRLTVPQQRRRAAAPA